MKPVKLPVMPKEGNLEPDPSGIPAEKNWVELLLPDHLSCECYAIRMSLSSNRDGVLVFSKSGNESDALEKIFCIGFHDRTYQVMRVLKNERPGEGSPLNDPASATRVRRKSFMTPTPLHIPTSRVSPIPGATHEALLVKPITGGNAQVLAAKHLSWMHPLVHFDPEGMRNWLHDL